MKIHKRILVILSLAFFQCYDSEDLVIIDDGPAITNPNGLNVKHVETYTEKELNAIHFINEETGYIVGGGFSLTSEPDSAMIMKTLDGGDSWEEVFRDTGYFVTRMTSLDNGTLFAATNATFILKSENHGKDWEKIEVISSRFMMTDIHFIDQTTGFLTGSIGATGIFLKTNDSGSTWSKVFEDETDKEYFLRDNLLSTIHSFSEAGKAIVLVSGGVYTQGKILRSDNGGIDWERIDLNGDVRLNDIKLNAQIGFSVGHNGQISTTEKGMIFKTTDKGKTWRAMETGFTNKLNSFDYKSNTICVVGSNKNNDLRTPEFIMISFDSGENWSRITHDFVVAGWNDVAFISNNKILAVGFKGRSIIMEIN